MSASLVGSEMCIRDSSRPETFVNREPGPRWNRGSLRQCASAGTKSETVVKSGSGPRWPAAVRIG
eukprot:3110400-Alexandrium_andersonii.AAC.1